MARKSKRSSSRKMKRTRKHMSHRRRTHRRGGSAPLSYSLSGSWPSQMSLGQGADYFKYHEGQHGGMAPISALGATLPEALRGPAHIGGIDKAINDVRGLKDPNQAGGKRRRHHKKSHRRTKHSRRRHSRKHSRTHRRRRGGSLGYSPYPSSGMLLGSQTAYAQAGLNPEWKTDIAFTDAKIRDTQ
jgi:hypothetical protein